MQVTSGVNELMRNRTHLATKVLQLEAIDATNGAWIQTTTLGTATTTNNIYNYNIRTTYVSVGHPKRMCQGHARTAGHADANRWHWTSEVRSSKSLQTSGNNASLVNKLHVHTVHGGHHVLLQGCVTKMIS